MMGEILLKIVVDENGKSYDMIDDCRRRCFITARENRLTTTISTAED
jgi:hypothetical protein